MDVKQDWCCGECGSELEFGDYHTYEDEGKEDVQGIVGKNEGVIGWFACPNHECKIALVKIYRNK